MFALRALGYGLLSAVSFPIGALLGLRFVVPQRTVGKLLAFGSGALILAVSVSLYATNLERVKVAMDPRCASARVPLGSTLPWLCVEERPWLPFGITLPRLRMKVTATLVWVTIAPWWA